MTAAVKKVVSISLGSDRRDHRAEVDLLGIPFEISRQGARDDLHINDIVGD
ncbi:hypothetical protein HY523_02340, partial [Candidatus Berkelbacteria bacterium]|nr:hypothetical protein [Candidatus Berkelbacteria bacterium]